MYNKSYKSVKSGRQLGFKLSCSAGSQLGQIFIYLFIYSYLVCELVNESVRLGLSHYNESVSQLESVRGRELGRKLYVLQLGRCVRVGVWLSLGVCVCVRVFWTVGEIEAVYFLFIYLFILFIYFFFLHGNQQKLMKKLSVFVQCLKKICELYVKSEKKMK